MELLTGKAKEAFEYFNRKNEFDEVFMDKINTDVNTLFKLHELYQQSVIIYWFDSVGIYVDASKNKDLLHFSYEVNFVLNERLEKSCIKTNLTSRQEATIAGIKKANEIFNSKF